MAVGQIAPMTLTCGRWAVALGPIAFAARGTLRRDIEVMRGRWLFVALMGALGFTGFNALFYVAAHRTGALNLSIIQGAIPAFVLIGARVRVRREGARAAGARRLRHYGRRCGDRLAGRLVEAGRARLQQRRSDGADRLLPLRRLHHRTARSAARFRPRPSRRHGVGRFSHLDPAVRVGGRHRRFHLADGEGLLLLLFAALGPAFRVAGLLHARRRIDRAGPGRGVRQSGARVRRADGGRLARRTVRRVPCRGVGSGRRRDRHRAARAVAEAGGG